MLREIAKALLECGPSRAVLSRAGKSRAGMQILNRFSGSRGVFRNFEEGWAAARKTGLAGHEDPNEVAVHVELAKSLRVSDYAALFWLLRASGRGVRVFDFGGNVGNLFYSYSPYLKCFGSLDWTVLDIPPVLERARKIAMERNAEGLRFASSAAQFRDDQVLLASGFLHYWEGTIAEFLEQFPVLPKHVIVNRSPISEKYGPFVVLQRTATAAFPCIVRNAGSIVAEFAALGYSLVDKWAVAELRLSLPLFPDKSVAHYSGLYLRHKRA